MNNKHIVILTCLGLLLTAGCGRKADSGHAGESTEEHAAHSAAAEKSDAHAGEAGHEEHGTEGLIEFSHELQKEFGIRVEPVQTRKIHRTIRAMAEITPAGSHEAEVVAPFAGVLMPDPERGRIVRPGERVSKGEHLAIIAPSTDADGWSRLLGDYRIAQAEFDRVSDLSRSGSVPARRLQEAKLDLEQKEARLRSALGGADPADLDPADMQFHLRSPASGLLTDVHLRYGQRVSMGEHLFNIVNPDRVWLEAHVPATESDRLSSIRDAYFSIGGSEKVYRTADLDGKLLSVGGLANPATRRIEVLFEISNPGNVFKPGSYAQAYLREDQGKEALAIPTSAVLDEDGIPVVIVQVADEDFRKVVLKTGAQDEGYTEVLSGLDSTDRVVVEGAYKVKVAAIKPAADAHAGHGH